MKIVITEDPVIVNRSFDVEFASCPKDAEVKVAVYDPNAADNSAFFAEIKDADIIINCYVNFSRELIDGLEKCKVISFESTGYNEVDLEYARERALPSFPSSITARRRRPKTPSHSCSVCSVRR